MFIMKYQRNSDMCVLTTSNVSKAALLRWYPEIGGTSIKNYFKFLWWGSNWDLAIILSIQII